MPGTNDGRVIDPNVAIARRVGVYYWNSVYLMSLAVAGLTWEHLSDESMVKVPLLRLCIVAVALALFVPKIRAYRAGVGRVSYWSAGVVNVDHEKALSGFGLRATRISDVVATIFLVLSILSFVFVPPARWSIGFALAAVPLAVHNGLVDFFFKHSARYDAGLVSP